MNNIRFDLLSKEDFEKILHKSSTHNSNFHSFKINKVSDKVLGFLGEHCQLVLTCSSKSDPTHKEERKFFLKSLPQGNDNQRAYIESIGIFQKEVLLYKNLLMSLDALASKPFSPSCYYTKSDCCMVMEDLKLKSFQVPSANMLTLDQAKEALKTLACMHAASIVYEEQRTVGGVQFRIDEHFPNEFIETSISYDEGHPRNKWAKTVCKCLQELSRYHSKDETITDKIHDFIFNKMRVLVKPSKTYRNVVCHNDLWACNMMFNDKNECILVDFQLARYTPPIFDVLYVLYINLDRLEFEANRRYLLDYYYDHFEKELLRHNLKSDKLLSKEEFYKSEKDYNLLCLVETALCATNAHLPEEIASRIVENQEIFEEFMFKNRPPYVLKEYENSNLVYRKRLDHMLIPLFKTFEKFEI